MLWILAALACGGPVDLDEDGIGALRDCDDGDPAVGLPTLAWADQDGDGFGDDALWAEACPGEPGWVPVAGDCDDADPSEHPEQERCNCERGDRSSVAWYADVDGDGVGEEPAVALSCGGGDGLASVAGDCQPLDPEVFPGATEIWYDGQDQDCSGGSDYDADLDGHESDLYGGSDCDDAAPETYPGAREICDVGQSDEDCDGLVNAEDPDARGWTDWYEDADGDGYGQGEGVSACAPAQGYATETGDCEDGSAQVNPGAVEVCGDGVANDCVVTPGECGIYGQWVMDDTPLLELPENASGNLLLGAVDLLGTGDEAFVVGSPYVQGGDGYQGQVSLLSGGSLQGLLSTEASYSLLGSAMVSGDLNQDGHWDLVVSAAQHYVGGIYSPRVFVALGPLSLGSSVDELPMIQDNNSIGTSLAIADGYLALNAPSTVGSLGGSGAVYLFDADPGAVSTLLDAAGELSFDGGYTMAGGRLAACDVLGTGVEGLLFGGAFGPQYDSGILWSETLEDGLTILGEEAIWVQDDYQEQLGLGGITCADGDQDGYPELWLLRGNGSGEVLAFESGAMQQGQEQAWIRVTDGSRYTGMSVRIADDYDGDGYVDLVINDPNSETYGAISVVYGPLSAGSFTMAENRVKSPTGMRLSGELAGSEEGLLIGASNGRSLYWLSGGPGI